MNSLFDFTSRDDTGRSRTVVWNKMSMVVPIIDLVIEIILVSIGRNWQESIHITRDFDTETADVVYLCMLRTISSIAILLSSGGGVTDFIPLLTILGSLAYSAAKVAQYSQWGDTVNATLVVWSLVFSAVESVIWLVIVYHSTDPNLEVAIRAARRRKERGSSLTFQPSADSYEDSNEGSLGSPLLGDDVEDGDGGGGGNLTTIKENGAAMLDEAAGIINRIGSIDGSGKALDKQATAARRVDKSIGFGRLLGLARPERVLLLWGTVALIISTLANMAIPTFIGQLIDDVVETEDYQRLDKSVLLLLLVLVGGSIFTTIRGALFNYSGERLVRRLRCALYESIAKQDISFFDEQSSGDLMNRLSSDTTVIQNAVTVNVSMGLRSLASVAISLALLFFTSWRLSLVMMAVVPLMVVAVRLYGSFARRISKEYQDALASVSEVAVESLGSVRTMRSFAAEPREMKRYRERVHMSYKLGVKKAIAYGFFMGGIGLVAYLAMLCVLWYGGRLVIQGQLSAGSLTAFVLYTVYIATGLGTLSGLFSQMMTALGASEKVFELIDRKPHIPIQGGVVPTEQAHGIISFDRVCFSYPSRPEMAVLSDFTLDIQANQTVALVGQSGSGKSTVLALLERFYDPTGGQILIDGHDITELDPVWLRRSIALVQQEPTLFSGTILDNICYGCFDDKTGEIRHISMEAVEEAAGLANCHEFISAFPDGYNTLVGERGVRLSGGQKQRVAIARALLVNPRIMILDEATSALDAESEHLVQMAMDNVMRDRTTIIIAHRLSTIKGADMIVVLQHGRIRDTGKHDELLEKSKVYKNLVRRQLAWGHEEEADLL